MDFDQRNTKGKIIEAAYRLFYRQGFARVSVDAIAERAGLTKRTIYYHFESKDDIIAEVLVVQHRYLMKQVDGWVANAPAGAPGMVHSLFSKLKEWADAPDWLGSGFSRIASELADMKGHPARRAGSMHKRAVEDWLYDQLESDSMSNADDLARQIMILIEGCMSLSLIHGDTRYVTSAMEAAVRLIENPRP